MYVELLAGLDQLLLGAKNDTRGQVNGTEWSRTQNIIPDPTNCLQTREDMRKPGKHPRYNKNQQFTLLEALKNLSKLRILPHDQIQDQFTDHHTDMTHIVL